MRRTRRALDVAAIVIALTWGASPALAAPPRPDPPAAAGDADEPADEPDNPPADQPESPDAVPVDDGVSVTSRDGRSLVLVVKLDGSETFEDLARRFAGDESRAPALRTALGNPVLEAGGALELPWSQIRPEYRYLALRALFPGDGSVDGAWLHRPADARLALPGEALWQVALWFTGEGERWTDLARENRLSGPNVTGRTVRIPEALLLPLFKRVRDGSLGLTYGEDAAGPWAEVRLGRGDTLYSGVVTRFTDLTRPDDVNRAAETIRVRSRIDDVRRMEVGQRVRIPLELLSTPFLPDNHPRRVLARLHEAEVVAVEPAPHADALDGVHVLLDPGHGGADVGAQRGAVWESDYVYDIACRVRRRLLADTAAQVKMLVRDTQYGWRVFDRRDLQRNRREVVDTEPPLAIRAGQTNVAVNRRWQFANDLFRDLTTGGDVPAEKVVFISLHADSLHRSMRGATVYVPGERYRRGAATTTRAGRLRDEAASRRLAWALVAGYRDRQLPVHDDRPVRDHVVRDRRAPWVPAVLRGNLVPAKVLLETANLGNADDARLIQSPDGRERIANAIVDGLLRYYSGGDESKTASRPRVAPAGPRAPSAAPGAIRRNAS